MSEEINPKFIRLRDICKTLGVSRLKANRFKKSGLLINYDGQRGYYTYESYERLRIFIAEYTKNFGYKPTHKACVIELGDGN